MGHRPPGGGLLRRYRERVSSAPAWVDELDLRAGLPEAAIGTRSLDESRWILVDDDWAAQRNEARRLLTERRPEVLAGDSGSDAAREVGDRIDAWIATHHPDLGDAAHEREPDPLAAARSRVAEDLCILTPDDRGDRGWVLAAGAVCFPSFWRLADKIGRPLAEVHDPVPGYPGPLAARVDGFLTRLRPGQGVWRRNWSIHDVPDLFLPEHGPPARGDERWLRSEHQTLLRLTTADAVLFTIRTQQVPLVALAGRPDIRAAMASAVRGWTPAQRAYKGGAVDERVVTALVAADP